MQYQTTWLFQYLFQRFLTDISLKVWIRLYEFRDTSVVHRRIRYTYGGWWKYSRHHGQLSWPAWRHTVTNIYGSTYIDFRSIFTCTEIEFTLIIMFETTDILWCWNILIHYAIRDLILLCRFWGFQALLTAAPIIIYIAYSRYVPATKVLMENNKKEELADKR